MKKIIGIMLVFILIASSISGCSKKNNSNTDNLNQQTVGGKKQTDEEQTDKKEDGMAMGRYMENELEFPSFGEEISILGVIEGREKKIELFCFDQKKGAYSHYVKTDSEWEERPLEWLKNKALGSKDNIALEQIFYGEDGQYYIRAINYDTVDSSQTQLYRVSKDEKTLEKIEISYLMKPVEKFEDEKERYPYIRKMDVMKNGTIVLFDFWADALLLFSGTDGSKVGEAMLGINKNEMSPLYCVAGDDIIGINSEQTGVSIYRGETQELEKITDFDISGSLAFDRKEDGTIFVVDSKGIHRLEKDGTLWETMVDGTLNSMGMPSLFAENLFVAGTENEIYNVIYDNSDGKKSFMSYQLDKTVTAIPSKNLTIYSLNENSTIRQAMALFQRNNSDVKVDYIVAMEDNTENPTDFIRTLNTELLTGNGADLLLLDGLPVESYLEKGVLMDMSDIFLPLIENGELEKNIAENYIQDGKVFGMPMRFTVPFILGEKEAIKTEGNLKRIVDYIKKHDTDIPYLIANTEEQLVKSFLAEKMEEIFSEDKTLDENKFQVFLKNLKVIVEDAKKVESDEIKTNGNYALKQPYTSDFFQTNEFEYFNGISKTAMTQVGNLSGAMLFLAGIEQLGGNYENIENMFFPQGEIGLNSNTKETELAKEFIKVVFSEEVQKANIYDGFPVNSKSFSKWIEEESNISEMASSSNDGVTISAEWPDKEKREIFFGHIRDASKPVRVNRTLYDMIVTEAVSYLTGNTTIEAASASLKSKVDIYLSE